ncbi:MAG TPA: hypothetical protein VI702_01810 [Nitrospiria bacterium]
MKNRLKMSEKFQGSKRGMGGLAVPAGIAALLISIVSCAYLPKYSISREMSIPVKEFSTAEYPEDPAGKSVQFGRYADRKLRLVRKDETHFDFIFEPLHPHIATVIFRNIDVSLMMMNEPAWVKADQNLELIALTDRQWNRQQVSFGRGPDHVEVSGGNGFEKEQLFSAELAKNCLNAGLWEVLLFTQENGQKSLYYQGWFDFPLGYYREIFERNTGVAYSKYWYRLEHWIDPSGTPVALEKLRAEKRELPVQAKFLKDEPIFASGEQQRKARTLIAKNILTWKDFYEDGRTIQFASFIPPGRYSLKKPWNNEFWRLSRFEKAVVRDIQSPAADRILQEVELVFKSGRTGEISRLFISGVDLHNLPQLAVNDYPKGLYMPMGIGVPPFYQSYDDLVRNPPYKSPYFSVLLDSDNRWINHHEAAVDGAAMHRDKDNPNLIHLYLLSYERHSLIGHFLITLDQA